jgi:hypothetical protein
MRLGPRATVAETAERTSDMEKTVSADGTVIAYDRLGSGPALVIVAGMLCDRAKMGPIAEELAKHFTVC